jgi:general secretion pathway protein J
MTRGNPINRHLHPQQAGFTLVEMMVSLSLFAAIAAMGVGLLRSSVDTQSAVQVRLKSMGGVNRLRAIMANDLGQSVPRASRGLSGEAVPAFLGSPSGFAFVRAGSANLDGAPRPRLQRVGYALVGDEWRRATQAMLDGKALDDGDRLIDEVSGIAVRYRDARGQWLQSWNSDPGDILPVAVEVMVTRRDRPTLTLMFQTAPTPPPPKPQAGDPVPVP